MAAYETLVNAEIYFANRLHILAWERSSDADKTIALTEASARIDRLHFKGNKVDDAQDLEFPRYYGDDPDGTEIVPSDIKIACCESAYALLDDVDPEQELENLAVMSRAFSSVRTTYLKGEPPEHFAAGIPSAYAWKFLQPYLAKSKTVRLQRVS